MPIAGMRHCNNAWRTASGPAARVAPVHTRPHRNHAPDRRGVLEKGRPRRPANDPRRSDKARAAARPGRGQCDRVAVSRSVPLSPFRKHKCQ